MLSVWCLVPGNYPTARRLRPLRSLIEDRTIAEKSIDLILSRYLLQFASAIDVGKAMNPQGVEMQNFGGACMGIGIALHEDMRFDENGRMANANLMDYKMPSFVEMPLSEYMKSIIVEVPHQEGPYGAKGAGEIVVVPTSPALGNAIYDAIGVRIWDQPLTPEKIVKAWKEKGAASDGG